MGISRWIESVNATTLENILVDILLADGMTYSGYINRGALAEDPDSVLLTSRPSLHGTYVGKKIFKSEIVGFNFSVAARANFGVHQIRLSENASDLHFQHAVHDQQHFLLANSVAAKDKFIEDCFSYLKKLNGEFVAHERITLILNRGRTMKYNIDTQKLHSKVSEFLGAPS